MSVGRFLLDSTDDVISRTVGEILDLEGWLVIIECRLYLIPEAFSMDYARGDKVEISNSELMFAVTENILPLGGGDSFIFHRAKVSGRLLTLNPLSVKLLELLVEERGQGFVRIEVSDRNAGRFKSRYDEFFEKSHSIDSRDWLDYR